MSKDVEDCFFKQVVDSSKQQPELLKLDLQKEGM